MGKAERGHKWRCRNSGSRKSTEGGAGRGSIRERRDKGTENLGVVANPPPQCGNQVRLRDEERASPAVLRVEAESPMIPIDASASGRLRTDELPRCLAENEIEVASQNASHESERPTGVRISWLELMAWYTSHGG